MTALRHNRGALNLGDAVPILANAPTGPARYCQRSSCATRLRRGNPGPYCDPCRQVLHPWVMPEMRTRTKNECPSCGNLKMRDSKRCRRCADHGIRLDFTGHPPILPFGDSHQIGIV